MGLGLRWDGDGGLDWDWNEMGWNGMGWDETGWKSDGMGTLTQVNESP